MLNIQGLTYLKDGIPLLENCDLQVFSNQHVGLVGKNGCGKSTLFRLILDTIKPDSGEVFLQSGTTVTSVEQEILSSNQHTIEFVLDGDSELRHLEMILEQKNHDDKWFEAQQRYEAIGGYTAKARAAQLLDGLGFAQLTLEQPVSHFSGGWRMRLNLARALMHRADLLLLDEPTNHLDLEAILWLEQYLAHYPGSFLIVSHDREFLNACVNQIAHISNRKIEKYSGNYDDFERTRAERLKQHAQSMRQQQRQIAHIEDFIQRFRAKATKAKQAQSRIKALERLTRLAPVQLDTDDFELAIEAPEHGPDTLLTVRNLGFAYDQQNLFHQVNLTLQTGARIALVGPNGAGKSTFIKLLTKAIEPTSGSLNWASNVRIGYFAQHQLESLQGNLTPLQQMQQLAPNRTELDLRNFLGHFGLGGTHENRCISSFSGGEKSRLALALIAWQKPHVLLLDEPTNHLDLEMRSALTFALESYAGAIVLVSHDRSLVTAIADELWLVSDNQVRQFDGDLTDYQAWLETRRAQENARTQPSPNKTTSSGAPSKPNKKKLLLEQAKLETNLISAQKEMDEVNRQLANPINYANASHNKISQLSAIRAELEKKIADLEESWLALESALEE